VAASSSFVERVAPPARDRIVTGGRRDVSQQCQNRDHERDDQNEPQEVADRHASNDREDDEQNYEQPK
jgi:hypothetical protein